MKLFHIRKRNYHMRKMSVVRSISIGGILTTLAVMFQSAPIFLPTIGMALSPLSSLPIALAAYVNLSLGISTLISSTILLMFISIEEALILLFTTGLLGVVLGVLYQKSLLISILYSAMALTIGMIVLTYIVGIAAFGDLTNSFSIIVTILIFIIFGIIYSTIWNIYLKKFIQYLIKMKLL